MSKGSWRTARSSGSASSSPTAATTSHDHVFTERGVPCFDGTLKDYRDYRRRAKLYVARKKLEDKSKETLILLMTGLSGVAWDCVEAIDENKLEQESELT